ncbi:YHYH domain-containing protein [Acinetobacter junii]|nr:YHYH domain-containing protein [Acinetobacter junii]MCU4406706.1 YHYH domain-containing protein [Acinetobacter junii]QUS48734.1 YHYH domain-containing protein [Acinetobacter junii]
MKKLIAIALLTTLTSVAFAHSGGTDSSGCHTNHKTGDRHCH